MTSEFTPHNGQVDNQKSTKAHFGAFERLERPSEHGSLSLDASTWESWEADAKRLLATTVIKPAGVVRSHRAIWNPEAKVLEALKGKHCAPGLTGYLLPKGAKRGKETALKATWYALPFDLDAVGCTVEALLEFVKVAFKGYRRLVWTTFSCEDGYASARVFLPLESGVSVKRLNDVFWWGRDRLLKAGLPESSVKPGEPTVDSRALDGRLFFLPAVPTPKVPGTEKWGGVEPRCSWGEPGDVFLDIAAVEAEGASIRAVEEIKHLIRFKGVPVPGGAQLATTDEGVEISQHGGGKGPKGYADFGALTVAPGMSLLDYALSLPVGSKSIGSPWLIENGKVVLRERDGDLLSATSGKLVRCQSGTIFLFSWAAGRCTVVHRGVAPEVKVDLDEILKGVPDNGGVTVAQERAEEVTAQAGRDKAREAMDGHTKPFHDRVGDRRAKALGLDPVRITHAHQTVRMAERLRPFFEAHLRGQGLLPSKTPCGHIQCLWEVFTHQLKFHRRTCHRLTCLGCGSALLGMKAAAIFWMPVVDQAGRVNGKPLGQREEVFQSVMTEADFKRWKQRHSDAVKTPPAQPLLAYKEESPEIYTYTQVAGRENPTPPTHPYVAFSQGGYVTVLHTLEIPMPRSGAKPVVTTHWGSELLPVILDLMAKTYLVGTEKAPDLDGWSDLENLTPDAEVLVMTGKVSSSQGLGLDPDAVAQMAGPQILVKADEDGPDRTVGPNAWVQAARQALSLEEVLPVCKQHLGEGVSSDLAGKHPYVLTPRIDDPHLLHRLVNEVSVEGVSLPSLAPSLEAMTALHQEIWDTLFA